MIRRAGSTATGLLISAGSLAALAILLLVAELLVRAVLPERCGRVRQEAELVAGSRRFLAPCFAPESSGGEDYLVALPAAGGDRQQAPLPRRRRPGVARIAVVGESSADLLAKHLAGLLDGPGCGGRYEVLNCAQPGSALEHVERRFDEVLGYEPDAVVLLFGHNIFLHFELDETKLRLQGLRAHSCMLPQLTPEPPARAQPLEARLGLLEKFLRRAAAAARARGVALAVATMPANLWLPPGASPGDGYEPRFLEAQFLAARGRGVEAIRVLAALAADRDLAYWHYQLGEQLARAGGDGRLAYRELHLAVDGDYLGLRAPGRVNDLLRTVAAEERLLLRDTERALELRAPDGLPGWDSFIDNCHLLPTALDHEGGAVLALLRDAARLPPACDERPTERFHKGLRDVLAGVFNLTASGPPDVAGRWYRGLALAVESWIGRDPRGADRDVSAFVDDPAFAAAADDDRGTRLLVAIAEGYHRAGRRERAFALNERARGGAGAEPWVQKGLFHLRQDELREARQAFERALALDASRQDAREFLRRLSEQSAAPHAEGADGAL